jgi:hypothetical protein
LGKFIEKILAACPVLGRTAVARMTSIESVREAYANAASYDEETVCNRITYNGEIEATRECLMVHIFLRSCPNGRKRCSNNKQLSREPRIAALYHVELRLWLSLKKRLLVNRSM